MGRQPNTVINPNTGRPIRVDGPTFQKLSERDKSYALKAERSNPSTTINPHTNRAILRDGPTAQKLRQESSCYSPRSNKATSMKECYEPFSTGDMGISGTREKASKKTSSSHHHHHHHHHDSSSSSHRSRHTSDIFDSSLPIILTDREEPVPRAAATRAQVVNNTRIAEPQAMESQADSFPMSSVTRASSTEAATSPPPHEHQQQYQNNIGIEDNNNYIRHYDATGRREDDTTSIVEESSPATDDSVPVEQADDNSVVQVTETSDDEVSSESRKPSTAPNGDHIQQVETTNDKRNRLQKVSPSQQQISLQPEEEEQVATSALQHQLSKQSFYVEIIEEEEKTPRQQSKGLVIEQISSPVTEPKPTHRSPSKELNSVRKNLFANVSPVVEQTGENRPPTTSSHTLSPGFSSDDEGDDCCSLM